MEEAITVWRLQENRKEMQKIVNENLEIVRHEVPRAEAIRRFWRNRRWDVKIRI